ncbi:MAG TPA: chitobiase/beta-hexosaminidase C-terminal domain-containing protein [Planctomycetota bacterium]
MATPTLSPAGGTYGGTQSVTISCGTSGATIYYTIDGTTPTTSSRLYGAAITVTATTTIKCVGSKGGFYSAIATAQYTIVAAPLIGGSLSATGAVGSAFSYGISCTGQAPISYQVSGLPPGLSFSGSQITGTPVAAGTFAVTLTATNAGGSDSKTLTITIGAEGTGGGTNGGGSTGGGSTGGGGTNGGTDPGGNVGGSTETSSSTTKVDTDGDGFPDEIEKALGTSETDSTSTPTGGSSAGTPQALTVSKLAVKLNFADTVSGKDSIQVSGTMAIPAGFVVGGQKVTVDVGGVIRTFILDDKGSNTPKGVDSFKLSVKKSKTGVAAQTAKYSVKLQKAVFSELLKDENLVATETGTDTPVLIPVVVLFNGQLLQKDQPQLFSGKIGKSGKTK